MRGALIAAGVAIACIAALAIWQLGDEDTGSETEEPEAPVETLDPLPKLPRGWTETVNPAGGFALGVPPGWSAKPQAARTTLKAPRSPVVVRVTADRTDEAIEADLGEYADGIAARLEPDAKRTPAPDPPTPDAPGYETAAVVIAPRAAGEPKGTGFSSRRVEVIVVRRVGLAAYPVLIASDVRVKPKQLDPIVAKLVRSLRGRPVASLVG